MGSRTPLKIRHSPKIAKGELSQVGFPRQKILDGDVYRGVSCGGEGMEAGLGKGRSWVALWSHRRPQPTLRAALELGWTFRVTLSGAGGCTVYPRIDQALTATGKGT